ncbi:hypothetical protein, variant 3 [Aphanomyces invadans]|uniref:HMG box domain-containing protein n=1 Tax=Aphanomyces invadans TaxID=157072 RepID=A0A024TM01_9STRA|nr:hypothetical protein, variant 2 [Aphanomyces invadans]XP_008876229.1 hypothetical protein, variant 3 [Aphanomyces invadans]ETV95057.1 hypothetical protein, variant 2 [Aphanomyces invadans]ETV95058.1 hypothetical protein, variant 3 [Aphanomyces invadans]|eukprot:XP_008876228.1 hypothetical protein, variant 2 [Aphanomyces invadans]
MARGNLLTIIRRLLGFTGLRRFWRQPAADKMESDTDHNDMNDAFPSDAELNEQDEASDSFAGEEREAAEHDENAEDDVKSDHDDTAHGSIVQDASSKKLSKPLSAYFHFLAENRAAVIAENPGLGIGPVQKILSTKWNELDAVEKEPYVAKATEDKQRYMKEKQALVDRGIDVDAPSTKRAKSSDDHVLTLPNARVKRIMQTDPDVHKVSKEAVLAITKATARLTV